MKNSKLYTLVILLMTVLVSCTDDFLERDPLGVEIADGYFYSDDNAVLAINGCYDVLIQNEGNTPDNVWLKHHYEFVFGEAASNNAHVGSKHSDGQGKIQQEVEFWDADNSNQYVIAWWIRSYVGVQRSNFVLNFLPQSEDVTAELKSRIIGEAAFLRAFHFFSLIRHFGGVPITLEAVQPDQYGNIASASMHEVFQQIEVDLLDAIGRLPNKGLYAPQDVGRATKGAAQSMLARVYMYQIGTDIANDKTWDDVYELTNDVIGSGDYSLGANYARVFNNDNENSSESVFEYQAREGNDWDQPGKTGQNLSNFTGPRGTGDEYGGWGFLQPSREFYEWFPNDDPRKSMTLFGDRYNGHVLFGKVRSRNTGQMSSEFYSRKFSSFDVPQIVRKSNEYNYRVIRYSDVLLMHAEAAYQKGLEAEARDKVNEVRTRARNSTYAMGFSLTGADVYDTFVNPGVADLDVTYTGQGLLDAIWTERRLELALEGYSSWDLIRTGRYVDAMEIAKELYFDSSSEHYGGVDKVDHSGMELTTTGITGRMTSRSIDGPAGKIPLLPVPQFETNNWGVAQNPGYSGF
jgi:hypothetical protein